MHRTLVSALGLTLFATIAAHADQPEPQDLNPTLHGSYTFSGTDACVVSFIGFTPTLGPITTPTAPSFTQTQTTQGTWTFNGDGTATSQAHSDTITSAPFPGASSSEFTAAFTYAVAADRTISVENDGPITGTILSGSRTGQTFTVAPSLLSGQIAAGAKGLTLSTGPIPFEEVITFSDGSSQHRICMRSRTLLRLSGDRDRD